MLESRAYGKCSGPSVLSADTPDSFGYEHKWDEDEEEEEEPKMNMMK